MTAWSEHLTHRASEFSRKRGIDGLLAVLIAVGAVLLLLFINLAEEVVEGETRAFDEAILLALRTPGDRSQPIGPLWLPPHGLRLLRKAVALAPGPTGSMRASSIFVGPR